MIRYSEAVLRGRIAEVPDGAWSDEGVIEADESWRVVLKLTKKGDRLLFDFTGSDKQASRGINLPYHATYGSCFWGVLSTLGHDLPKNQGEFGPIEVVAPKGTVVHVEYPGPVSLNTTSGMTTVKYVVSCVLTQMLAASEKWRGEAMAAKMGARQVRHAGVNQYGTYYVSTLLELDGHGAAFGKDGINSGGGLTCHNVGVGRDELSHSLSLRRHVKDGAGAGKFRGGSGAEAAIPCTMRPRAKSREWPMGWLASGTRVKGSSAGFLERRAFSCTWTAQKWSDPWPLRRFSAG